MSPLQARQPTLPLPSKPRPTATILRLRCSPVRYSVSAEAQGFGKTIETINLDVDQHARLDFSLKPGEVNESVTVEANAAILETQSAEIGNVRTSQAVNDLPINGRDFFADLSRARHQQLGNRIHDVARRQQSVRACRAFP